MTRKRLKHDLLIDFLYNLRLLQARDSFGRSVGGAVHPNQVFHTKKKVNVNSTHTARTSSRY